MASTNGVHPQAAAEDVILGHRKHSSAPDVGDQASVLT